jgi:energy-coupling factor transporter ATP-binding protein EcfA2
MQISDIVLYSHDGRRRILKLREGALNIITGESQSGKSALIEVLHYCLDSATLRVPSGVIAAAVSWYGVRLSVADGTTAFIGRPAPQPGALSATAAMLTVGSSVPLPEAAALEANTTLGAVEAYLTGIIGIAENETARVLRDAAKLPLEANISHALFYCFQRQDEIANRRLLFHRQAEDYIGQAIRDTLPYFTGAVDRNYLVRRAELQRLRDTERQQAQRLERLLQTNVADITTAAALVSEVRDVGLIAPNVADEVEEPLKVLAAAVRSALGADDLETETGQEFSRLERRRTTLTQEYKKTRDEIAVVRSFLSEDSDFSTGVAQQAARLRCVNLLPEHPSSTACPICGQDTAETIPGVSDLVADLADLTGQLESVQRDAPRLRRLLNQLDERAQSQRDGIREVRQALEAIAERESRVAELRDRLNAQSFVRGRVTLFLEGAADSDDQALRGLREGLDETRQRISLLTDGLDWDAVRENVASILNAVGVDMRSWAARLKLEHSDGPVRIDPVRLNVVADTVAGSVALDRMGSAANWVGYHLVAHLALHKFFREKGRPVPRFVVFDQPTQAFYPPERPRPDTLDDLEDADREAVARMFELLHDVAGMCAPTLQIIVTDHAHLDADWFQDAIVEEWRGGLKLIPSDWPLAAADVG